MTRENNKVLLKAVDLNKNVMNIVFKHCKYRTHGNVY